MFAITPVFVLSLLSSALALSTRYPIDANGSLVVRDAAPSDADLLKSCPGGPGADGLKRADKCTLINVVQNANTRDFVVLGDPQLNCGGASDEITVALGGETTISETTTVNAELGFNTGGLNIGGGASQQSGKSQTVSKTITYSIPPGRQAVYVAGTAQRSETGNVQVNYGSKQAGHFVWFTGSTITRLTPIPDDIVFDVHESDCGTDPRKLS
ncbi:hypothetical protein C8Q79DRAFT_928648 [Trametes meyenii]|nr:hypothetical protein C8Q79DRAFT_928648 [Trametes meyenii]